jgi:vacuolar-type H+-ATPase subunit E/Vma4
MSIEGILSAIRRETEAEVAAITAQSEAEAAARIRAAHEEAARIEEETARGRDAEASSEARRRVRRARLEADQVRRAAREAAFGEALDEVRRRLATLRNEPTYPDVLAALLAEARTALPDAKVARADPADAAVIMAILDGTADGPSPCLEIQPVLSTWGGVELTTDGGRRVVDTLESRLGRAEPHLRRVFAASVPFPERPDG